jgi:hypothetical protein
MYLRTMAKHGDSQFHIWIAWMLAEFPSIGRHAGDALCNAPDQCAKLYGTEHKWGSVNAPVHLKRESVLLQPGPEPDRKAEGKAQTI